MLSCLWQENLFLVRMEEPGWYRYHDSFAETLCSQLQRQLATDSARKPLPKAELTSFSAAASITAREQQVLRLVTSGLTNREIATQLSFAESTVKTHLKNIYRKLGVNSRTRAIMQAQALKLV